MGIQSLLDRQIIKHTVRRATILDETTDKFATTTTAALIAACICSEPHCVRAGQTCSSCHREFDATGANVIAEAR